MKRIIANFVTIATVLVIAGTSLAAEHGGGDPHLTIDPDTLKAVDMALSKLQEEMIQKNYSAMMFKPQMMEKMINERASQNYMQGSIQPFMMEKMRNAIKPKQMELVKKTAVSVLPPQ
jgi:hypothetical protein